jgi:hypothetical protein
MCEIKTFNSAEEANLWLAANPHASPLSLAPGFVQNSLALLVDVEPTPTELVLGHQGTATVEWVNQDGSPAKVDGPTVWSSSDPAVLTCEVSTGNPLIANLHAETVGTAEITASADADLGGGVRMVTATLGFSVVGAQGEAVGGALSFTDMGAGPS